jgi:phosphoribosylformimino-5-aminoimidazole carboxamide ribotide isomerase
MLVRKYVHRTFRWRVFVVPVIDLMGGHAVHARRGERASYHPLATPLARSSDPLDVVRGLLAAGPFRALYVADLDAIRGAGNHAGCVHAIRTEFPDLEVWLDAGVRDAAQLEALSSMGLRPVIGTESLPCAEVLAAMLRVCPSAMLSLDTRGEERLGPAELFTRPLAWPSTVIVMTLERVGSGTGPAAERLRAVRTLAPDRRVVAAGGVRDAEDLETLEALGVHAALVASAIHDGSLDRAVLGRFAGP